MSSISSRFYVTALEDGTTLHGNLAVDGSLTQAYTGESVQPDWSMNQGQTTSEQPTVYLTLLSGSTMTEPDNGYNWYYNDVLVTFEENETVLVIDGAQVHGHYSSSPQHLFFKHDKRISGKNMPALRIVANVAGSGNVDIDTLRFDGTLTTGGSPIAFSATTQIRISRITANESLGIIAFVNGVADITTHPQTITVYGLMYGSGGRTDAEEYTTRWYLNNVQQTEDPHGVVVDGVTYSHAIQITDEQVVDQAIIRCEFLDKTSGSIKYVTYESIDDMQDPEYMYIQYDGSNGNAASLRKGTRDSVKFYVWIGKVNDPSVDTSWSVFKVKLLDGNGNVIFADMGSGIPQADQETGLRTLEDRESNKAFFTLHYDDIADPTKGKRNVTGFIYAEQTQQQQQGNS